VLAEHAVVRLTRPTIHGNTRFINLTHAMNMHVLLICENVGECANDWFRCVCVWVLG
jgi:hypothetical protein